MTILLTIIISITLYFIVGVLSMEIVFRIIDDVSLILELENNFSILGLYLFFPFVIIFLAVRFLTLQFIAKFIDKYFPLK